MDAAERLTTVVFNDQYTGQVEDFCLSCKEHGYKNNESLKAMKLEWCLVQGGQFFLTYYDDKIISLSGCHPLPQAGKDVYRILFRGITLPEYKNLQGALNKAHMNSIPFYNHIPEQVKWIKGLTDDPKLVITTNHANEITSMEKSHRVFKLLEKQQIVSCMHERLSLFNTDQSVWLLNQDIYNQQRLNYTNRNYV